MKRIIVVLMCVLMIVCSVGCRKTNQATVNSEENTKGTTSGNETQEVAIEKPESITLLWSPTISVGEKAAKDDFVEALSQELGIEVSYMEYAHNDYYDILGTAFLNDKAPDVMILDPKHYKEYSEKGYLWDMADAWTNSDTKASGRITAVGNKYIANSYVGEKLYGIPYQRGNGCVTYVRTKWLEECNLSVPTNYEEYYNMLVTFRNKYNVAPLTAPGFISTEAPYTTYLPEFYQDAYPTFYKNDEGKWVDGFTQEAMKAAIERLKNAYDDGLFDNDTKNNNTVECREGIINEEHGVMTYWAGTWAVRFSEKLKEAGVADSRFTLINAIDEVGGYVERNSYVIAILAKANNPEGIFKYFVEPMFDGDKIQTIWTYGVENKQWSVKKEKIKVLNTEYSFLEGEFHFLKNDIGLFNEGTLIKDELSISTFKDGCNPALSAATALVPQAEIDALKILEDDGRYEREYLAGVDKDEEIMLFREGLIADIVTGKMTYDEAITKYENTYGNYIEMVLKAANAQ